MKTNKAQTTNPVSASASTDAYYLYHAYTEALKALIIDEVPIGAVIVKDGQIIARGYNKKEQLNDALAHAEILAIQEASTKLASWRLNDCTLYTTLEPCYMCASAILQARVGRVVYAAKDTKAGGESCLNLLSEQHFNHLPAQQFVEVPAYSDLVSNYFKRKRKTKVPGY